MSDKKKCDQFWRNFANLAQCSKSLAIFDGLLSYWQNLVKKFAFREIHIVVNGRNIVKTSCQLASATLLNISLLITRYCLNKRRRIEGKHFIKLFLYLQDPVHWLQHEPCSHLRTCRHPWRLGKPLGEFFDRTT